MSDTDHKGMKKIQAWVKQETWDLLESRGYTSPTTAVTEAFDLLLKESPKNPDDSQQIPELRAQLEGLRLLLEEKDQRIAELKQDKESLNRDKETLSIFAHYFKSLEYKRIESQDTRTRGGHKETAGEAKRENTREEPKETRVKPKESRRGGSTGHEDKDLIQKTCKNCYETFFTDNPRKETCSDKCRSAYSRRKNKTLGDT